jgi:hypothetical protein
MQLSHMHAPPPAGVPVSRLLREHLRYDRREQEALLDAALPLMNDGQRAAFEDIWAAVLAAQEGSPVRPTACTSVQSCRAPLQP